MKGDKMDEQTMNKELERFDITESAIAVLSKKYMQLIVKDVDDMEGFEQVHAARMDIKGRRVQVTKTGKEIRGDAIAFQKAVLAKERAIVALLEPIETHLQTQENKVIQEQERIKAEEEQIQREKIQSRVDALGKYKLMLPFFDVAAMLSTEFEARLAEAKTIYEAEEKCLADEHKEREEFEKKLAAERVENARIRKEQEAKAKALQEKEAAIVRERQALEAAKRAEIEKKEREAFEKQAKENARIQAEEKIEREARKKKECKEAARLESERQEKLKPAKERILRYAIALRGVEPPKFEDKEAKDLMEWIETELECCIANIVERIKDL